MISWLSNSFEYNSLGMLYLMSSLLSLAVGILVLTKDPRSNVHRSFFLITFTGAGWLFSFACLMLSTTDGQALLWHRINYGLFVPFIAPSVYLFTLRWARLQTVLKPIYFFAIALVLAAWTWVQAPQLIEIQHLPWGRFNHYILRSAIGRGFAIAFFSFFLSASILGLINILRGWRSASSSSERKQYQTFLLAFFFGYMSSNDFLVALGLNQIPTGHIAFGLFILVIAYGIARHQFLEVNLFLRKASLFALIYVLLITITLPPALLVLRQLSDSKIPLFVLLSLSLSLGFLFSLGPMIYAALIRHSYWLRGHLTTGLTHELKSPLSAIQNSVDLLNQMIQTGKPDPQRMNDYLAMIERNASRLEGFVGELLNVARTSDAPVTINKTNVDLGKIARIAIDAHRSHADGKKLFLELEATEPFTIQADKEKLSQVFSNVISNAIKFTETGRIVTGIIENKGTAVISIRDQGRGVDPRHLDRLFDRFFKVDPNSKGSGIGLTIAKAWVEAHGGKIWAESEGVGKGTTVRFTVPIS